MPHDKVDKPQRRIVPKIVTHLQKVALLQLLVLEAAKDDPIARIIKNPVYLG
jgi:hypothetical protein